MSQFTSACRRVRLRLSRTGIGQIPDSSSRIRTASPAPRNAACGLQPVRCTRRCTDRGGHQGSGRLQEGNSLNDGSRTRGIYKMIYDRFWFGVSAASSATQTAIEGIRRMSLTDTPLTHLLIVASRGKRTLNSPPCFFFSQSPTYCYWWSMRRGCQNDCLG